MDCPPPLGPQLVMVMSSKDKSQWCPQCIIRWLGSQCHCCPLSHPQSPVLWGVSLWSFFPSILQGRRVWCLDGLPRRTHWLTGKLMQRWLLVHCNCVCYKKKKKEAMGQLLDTYCVKSFLWINRGHKPSMTFGRKCAAPLVFFTLLPFMIWPSRLIPIYQQRPDWVWR